MATLEHSRVPQGKFPQITGFENRCLIKRIQECHEILNLAIMGTGANQTLKPVCDALVAAGVEISRAEQLVATGKASGSANAN